MNGCERMVGYSLQNRPGKTVFKLLLQFSTAPSCLEAQRCIMIARNKDMAKRSIDVCEWVYGWWIDWRIVEEGRIKYNELSDFIEMIVCLNSVKKWFDYLFVEEMKGLRVKWRWIDWELVLCVDFMKE